VLVGRRAGAFQELVQDCEAVGGQALAVPTDVTDEAAVADFFGYVPGPRGAARFREQGHSVLINSASVYSHVGAPWLTAYVSSNFAVRSSAAVWSGSSGLGKARARAPDSLVFGARDPAFRQVSTAHGPRELQAGALPAELHPRDLRRHVPVGAGGDWPEVSVGHQVAA
jgi:hypothetical protein